MATLSATAMNRQWLIMLLKVALGVTIGVIVVRALAGHTSELRQSLAAARWLPLAVGTALALVYRLVNATGWSLILRSLGHAVPVVESTRIWLIAETLRWLPGSVWGFCSRVREAGKLGVGPVPASLSLPLELIVTIGAWALTALGGFLISGMAQSWMAAFRWQPLAIGLGVCVGLVATVVLCLRAFPKNPLAAKVRGFHQQLLQLLRIRPNARCIAAAFAFYTVLCILNGVAFFAILSALIPSGTVSLASCIGVNAAAWLAGFFAIAAPGGIAVREAGAAALLAPQIGFQNALLAAILWRVVQVVVEFVCLGMCSLRVFRRGAMGVGSAIPACSSPASLNS